MYYSNKAKLMMIPKLHLNIILTWNVNFRWPSYSWDHVHSNILSEEVSTVGKLNIQSWYMAGRKRYPPTDIRPREVSLGEGLSV